MYGFKERPHPPRCHSARIAGSSHRYPKLSFPGELPAAGADNFSRKRQVFQITTPTGSFGPCPSGRKPGLRAGNYLRHNDVVKNVGEPKLTGERKLVGEARNVGEQSTRARVARLILENGPVSAAALGSTLGLTPAAVRRHLDQLLESGMVESRTARVYGNRGRGRPARVFAITDAGRSAFEHTYDDLATSALRFIEERVGSQAVAEFARRQVAELERRYRPVVGAAPPEGRVKALAEALSTDGYAATVTARPASRGIAAAGDQLCQHHCPVAHVAAKYPQLCEAETEAFGRLLETPVQRLATIAHGDGVCTTHVTAPSLRTQSITDYGTSPGDRSTDTQVGGLSA